MSGSSRINHLSQYYGYFFLYFTSCNGFIQKLQLYSDLQIYYDKFRYNVYTVKPRLTKLIGVDMISVCRIFDNLSIFNANL